MDMKTINAQVSGIQCHFTNFLILKSLCELTNKSDTPKAVKIETNIRMSSLLVIIVYNGWAMVSLWNCTLGPFRENQVLVER